MSASGDATPALARILGPFLIERELARGAMGVVLLATRVADGERVALKLLRPELAQDEAYRTRLEREARIARSVSHPRLVRVLDAGEVEGRPFIAFAFVAGPSLADRLTTDGALGVPATLALAGDLGAALDALHAAELVHRDLKPANILLDADGRCVVGDFGYARDEALTALTRPGRVLGTLDYVAPEVLRGERASAASDIYALGCVVHECLAGAPPFAHRGVLALGRAHLAESPPPLDELRDDVPRALAWLVARALEKDPAERPSSAGEYARMLRVGYAAEAI
jgi:serine/threonine-protein kinase